MVILNRNLIFYVCVARGTTIVAEFNSKDEADLGALAAKCLESTPPFHSSFSHTSRNKTYTFLIDAPFVYFGIFDDKFDKSQALSFLNCVKTSFEEIFALKRLDSFDPHCFQAELNPVLHQLLALSSNRHSTGSGQLDSQRGQMIRSNSSSPEDRSMRLKKNKKKVLISESKENNLDMSDDDDDLKREFSVANHKNGSFGGDGGQQKAKRIWKKQVWVVLSLDLILCSILFVMWLWICRGFKCIDG